jgi:hypothetical protein
VCLGACGTLVCACGDENAGLGTKPWTAQYAVENRTTELLAVEAVPHGLGDPVRLAVEGGQVGVLKEVSTLGPEPFPHQILRCVSVRSASGVLVFQDTLEDWTRSWEWRALPAGPAEVMYVLILAPDRLTPSGVEDVCAP